MIQANELRIGNWVQRPKSIRIDILDGGKIYWLVNTLMIRDCEYYKDNWAFEPIPITPEILEKCGFEKCYESKIHSVYFINGLSYYFWHESGKQYANIKATELQCKNLHQLQNLYFALTGEELTFKP